MQDDDLFSREMGDVRPLRAEKRVSIRREDVSKLAVEARRRSAEAASTPDDNFLSTAEIDILDAHYLLSWRGDGVQHGVFRKLKQGVYAIDARLDLHRMTVERARMEVYDFVRDASELGLRCLLIIHGRGQREASRGAVLKSYLNLWLPQLPAVLAFVSAQPRHGGVGATYVLLKKSQRDKQENRLRFNRGRVE